MLRILPACLAVLLAAIPASAFAQASIAGVVRDSTGSVLPYVIVEATSEALIEKVRTATTNGGGRYRIDNLRPGLYTVTFTLAGFSLVRREGVELFGSLTATIDANMRPADLAELVTVTGESPVVDVQNAVQQRVMGRDVIDAIPTGRSERSLALLVPAVTATGAINQDVGGSVDPQRVGLSAHGSRPDALRITRNGLSVGITGPGGDALIAANLNAYEEVTIDTSAMSADLPTGGVRINLIPREGGNRFSSTAFGTFATGRMQGNNLTPALQAAGLRPDALSKTWDLNPGGGGPIKRDKLWFYAAYETVGNESYPGGAEFNLTANFPEVWTYTPDPVFRPINHLDKWDLQGRLTWLATEQLKVAVGGRQSGYCSCSADISATVAPEAALYRTTPRHRSVVGDWTAPITERFLIDGSVIRRNEDESRTIPPGTNLQMVSVTEQTRDNLIYRAVNAAGDDLPLRETMHTVLTVRTAFSYTTGSHAFKTGVTFGTAEQVTDAGYGTQPASVRFNDGVPNQITLYAYPLRTVFKTNLDVGAFVQDKWTMGRLTASYGLRYDHHGTSFPEQIAGPTLLLPDRNLKFAAADGVSWNDVTPKSGAVLDLLGNGKTAVKVSFNKYLLGGGAHDPLFGSRLNPVNRVGNVTTRSWTDDNSDFVPDCDLAAPAADGECGPMANENFGGSVPDCDLAAPAADGECGPMANENFGGSVGSTVYDPSLLKGWGVRGYDWELSAGVQQQLLPHVSLDVSYFRRWYGNFAVQDNRAVGPADVTAFSVAVPGTDSRLPVAGQTVGGFFDLNPDAFGLVDNYITKAGNFGGQTETWRGVDATLIARFSNGLLVHGGSSTGRTRADSCALRAALPERALTDPFCATETPMLTRVKALAAYTIPRIEVQVSGVVQNIPGPAVNAYFNAPTAEVETSLERPLSGDASSVTVTLIEPNTTYLGRVNQVDLRIGRAVRFRGMRAALHIDLFNALNGSAVLAVNDTVGGATAWQAPQSILQARLIKLSAQFDF